MTGRVFFYCNALSDAVRSHRQITTDSPAATRKVFGMSRALASAGCTVTVISMGRGRAGRRLAFYPAFQVREQGVLVRYGPFVPIRGLSELVTVVWLLWWAIRASIGGGAKRHLFYNQLTAFLPALVWLRMVGARTVADIEDGPIDARVQATLRTRGNAPPRLFARFITDGALIACRALAGGTIIRPIMPCYGAVGVADRTSSKATHPMTVLLSGWIHEGTGGDLLLAALRRMIEAGDERLDRLSIEVTGFGDGLDLLARAAASEPRLRLTVHGRLDRPDYSALLERAAIGLSLKTHASAYADTTFPSKVMEYAERGLCVLSTDISDVRRVFGDTVRYLTADDPTLLAAELGKLADQPEDVQTLGRAARALVGEHFSDEAVGRNLREFLFAGGEVAA